jgi:carbohydrate binding protein with CBM6 domain/F5/8 type C domain-containing protein/fibronectin type III domain protein
MRRCLCTLVCVVAFIQIGRTAEAGSLTISWDPNPEADIAGYIVNYGTSPGSYSQRLDVGRVTAATLTSLTDGVVYYVAVAAYNASGTTSPLSAEVSGLPTVAAPAPIVISSLTADKTFPALAGTTITWTAVASGGATLEYQFWLWSSSTGWVSRPYSTSNRFSWTPTASDVGQHQVQVDVRSVGSSLAPVSRQTELFSINASTTSGPTPYGGTPAAIPGTIEAERFDEGGEGVAYHDLDATNNGGQFRTTGVDIEATTDTGGGYNVGWMRAGEWLIYSVTVATAGSYTLDARVASSGTGGTFHVEANGVNVTGTLAVPNTGAWQSWQSVTKTVTLAAGLQTLRLVVDSDGPGGSFGNVNLLRLTAATTTAPPPPTTTNLALNKPATASSTEATAYVASAATDGNTGTRWSSAFTDPQWIQVDLGGAASIQRVVLRWEDAYGRAYQVQVSADAQTWTTIASTTTGDGGVDDLPVSGSGRYVRVYGTVRGTPWGYSLWELEVYGTTSSTAPPPAGPQPVTWTQLVRSTASGSTLTKTSGCDGCADAGAVSQQTITSGDGYVEFTAGDATKLRIIGLSNGNTGTATQDIAFGISLTSGYAEVREQNVYRTDTRYTASDVFRIAVEAGTVKYYKNGALWYTRSAAPSYPLLVDTSLLSLNATLSNVVISGR